MDARPSSQQPRVAFRIPGEEEEDEETSRQTLNYERRDLQKRLDIELQLLFDCDQEDEELPELEIDELLDLSDSEQRSRLNMLLQQCEIPTEDFINSLLNRIKGLHRTPSTGSEVISEILDQT